jgi:hypothetical protein
VSAGVAGEGEGVLGALALVPTEAGFNIRQALHAATLILGCLLAGSFQYAEGQQSDLRTEMERMTELARSGLFARATQWRCTVTIRFVCSPKGCERPAEWNGWILLDSARNTYERCDLKGCDSYLLQHRSAGIYTTAGADFERGMYLKALNDGSEFVESLSLGTAAYTNFGACVPID